MDDSNDKRRLRPVILFGIVYLVVGITFAALANHSYSNETRVMWQRAAWLVSAAAFAVHIAYEHFRQRNLPPSIALHVSVAVALGAFALALSPNVHALWAAPSNHHLLAFALVLWPIVTGVPAFVVALALAAGLARIRRRN